MYYAKCCCCWEQFQCVVCHGFSLCCKELKIKTKVQKMLDEQINLCCIQKWTQFKYFYLFCFLRLLKGQYCRSLLYLIGWNIMNIVSRTVVT